MKRQDHYYRLARLENYRSRASYKLKQLDEKFHIFKKANIVLDLGASPGGWSQVALEKIGPGGFLIGVDLKPVKRLEHAIFLKYDIMDDALPREIENILINKVRVSKVDVIISDIAPHISGNRSIDHARSIMFCERAWYLATKFLNFRGNMVIKVFQGDMLNSYKKYIEKYFDFCKIYVPNATRSGSREVYIVCKRFKYLPEFHSISLSPSLQPL